MTQVRPAGEQDAEALAALDRATWTTTTSPAPVPAPDQPFGDQDQRLADVLVAEQSGCPVGYVRVAQAVPLASHAHVLEVQGLAVDAAAQGQGTGRLLVEAVVRLARERGARKLSLRVLAPTAGPGGGTRAAARSRACCAGSSCSTATSSTTSSWPATCPPEPDAAPGLDRPGAPVTRPGAGPPRSARRSL